MKAVLFSIKPRHCERFVYGDKTDEIRKAAPLLQTPFKGYIYQTNAMWGYPILRSKDLIDLIARLETGKGMVIGECICDRVVQIDVNNSKDIAITSCLSLSEMWDYAKPKSLFDLKAIHVTELKIYDKPMPLSAFRKTCVNDLCCESCGMYSNNTGACGNAALQLIRPPQSWCYVEELQNAVT